MKTATSSSLERTAGATRWDRKVSVAISMPERMVEGIDRLRGDIPRSVFVCKILQGRVNVKESE